MSSSALQSSWIDPGTGGGGGGGGINVVAGLGLNAVLTGDRWSVNRPLANTPIGEPLRNRFNTFTANGTALSSVNGTIMNGFITNENFGATVCLQQGTNQTTGAPDLNKVSLTILNAGGVNAGWYCLLKVSEGNQNTGTISGSAPPALSGTLSNLTLHLINNNITPTVSATATLKPGQTYVLVCVGTKTNEAEQTFCNFSVY